LPPNPATVEARDRMRTAIDDGLRAVAFARASDAFFKARGKTYFTHNNSHLLGRD
jgi:hypothetical protein